MIWHSASSWNLLAVFKGTLILQKPSPQPNPGPSTGGWGAQNDPTPPVPPPPAAPQCARPRANSAERREAQDRVGDAFISFPLSVVVKQVHALILIVLSSFQGIERGLKNEPRERLNGNEVKLNIETSIHVEFWPILFTRSDPMFRCCFIFVYPKSLLKLTIGCFWKPTFLIIEYSVHFHGWWKESI